MSTISVLTLAVLASCMNFYGLTLAGPCTPAGKPCRARFTPTGRGVRIEESCTCPGNNKCSDNFDDPNRSVKVNVAPIFKGQTTMELVLCQNIHDLEECGPEQKAMKISSKGLPSNATPICKCPSQQQELHPFRKYTENNQLQYELVCVSSMFVCAEFDNCSVVSGEQTLFTCKCPGNKVCKPRHDNPQEGICV